MDRHESNTAGLLPDTDGGGGPGSQPAHFVSGREDEIAYGRGNEGHLMSDGGDRDNPGELPPEIVPNAPDEVSPGQGDTDQPDSAPIESPPRPDVVPAETPPPD